MSETLRSGAPTTVEHGGIAIDRFDPMGEPDGPPIIVIHGAMDRAAGFRRTIRHLPHREVYTYDRRGYGRSVERGAPVDFSDHLDDLAVVMEVVGSAALLVGHSMGGVVAQWALATAPLNHGLVAAVIWEAPTAWQPWYRSRGGQLIDVPGPKAAELFIRSMLGDAIWERMPERMREERRSEGEALKADIAMSRLASTAAPYDRIIDPVLVGYGTASNSNHQRSAQETAAALPNATLREIDGADHGIHLSRPKLFAEFISSWGTAQ